MRTSRVVVSMLVLLAVVGAGPLVGASQRCPHVSWGSLEKESSQVGVDTFVTGVRVGRHTCFDRLVIDLGGETTGYRVRFVSQLEQEGSGHAVPISGGAILAVTVLAPPSGEDGEARVDGAAVDATNVGPFGTFRDVAWAGGFEGQTTLGLGVRARLPFRVFALDGPGDGSRLVIDVTHHWPAAAGSPSPTLPGEPFDGFPNSGDHLGVMGVAHDDVLNIRAAPGTDQKVVAKAAPTLDNAVATGRARMLQRSIWYEVSVDGVIGWANSKFLTFVGSTDDVTSAFLNGAPRPETETMVEMGELVAAGFASDDPPSRIVQSVAASVGDLGDVTYDVIGFGDDSVAGVRLHIFAAPSESGEGFVLTAIEATEFCGRGSDGTICV